MVADFANHNITPCFIFEGSAPEEKKDAIHMRAIKKAAAKQKYDELVVATSSIDAPTSTEDVLMLQMLKEQTTKVSHIHVDQCKELLKLLGIPHYTAVHEADTLCVDFVLKGKAWACMSQDMDMFLYGCKRILRRYKNNYYLYDLDTILMELQMNMDTFRKLFILFGTDYGNVVEGVDKQQLMERIFNDWKGSLGTGTGTAPTPNSIFEWFEKEFPHETIDKKKFEKIYKMFENEGPHGEGPHDEGTILPVVSVTLSYKRCSVPNDTFRNVMQSKGFIFI